MKVIAADVVAVVAPSAGATFVTETTVMGLAVSTVIERVAGAPALPTSSTRRTPSECGPSVSDANDLGDTQAVQAPAPST